MRTYLTAPRKLLTLFVLLSVLPLAALGWLGWRLLEQDRALETQRLRERLESAVNLLAPEVDRGLAAWEDVLTAADDSSVAIPPGAVLLIFDGKGILSHQGLPLLYHPVAPAYSEVAGDVFAAPEAAVAGSPSELVASRERIALFTTMGDEEGRTRETASLVTLLSEGRLPVDRSTFDFYSESIPLPPPVNVALQLAEAVKGMWPVWQQAPAGRTCQQPPAGRSFEFDR